MTVKPLETKEANLQIKTKPIHEWVFSCFLHEVSTLLVKGIRNDYIQVEEETRFIRGRLHMQKQLGNQLRAKADRFHIEHDIYTPNRLENRLIATALRRVQQITKVSDNQRLANRLTGYFADIPSEIKPQRVWKNWRKSRLLQQYERVKPWCELILFGQNPEFMAGNHRGIALLFDMNKLFEHYVAMQLRLRQPKLQVETQVRGEHLLHWVEYKRDCFQLKPDLRLQLSDDKDKAIIADCKWKLLNQQQTGGQYESPLCVSQSDMYQMQAYAVHYLPKGGNLMLIYPRHQGFNKKQTMTFATKESDIDKRREWTLHIIPFELDDDTAMNIFDFLE